MEQGGDMNQVDEVVRIALAGIERALAMQWLSENIGVDGWPMYVEGYRSGRMVGNWRFVDTYPDRDIVLANMIDPCITKEQLAEFVSIGFSEVH